MFVLYIPLGYLTDTALFRYRQRKTARETAGGR
jgi:hypothetical protein